MAIVKLPKTFKKKWVAALRSRKYKQGTSSLHNPATDSYCCLGVGFIVANPGGFPEGGILRRNDVSKNIFKSMSSPMKGHVDVQGRLIELNDTKRWTFDRIADWIERYL